MQHQNFNVEVNATQGEHGSVAERIRPMRRLLERVPALNSACTTGASKKVSASGILEQGPCKTRHKLLLVASSFLMLRTVGLNEPALDKCAQLLGLQFQTSR